MINKDNLTQHISQQFNAELEEVRSHLLAMGGLVEKQVNDAVTALIEADSGLAQQVREIDDGLGNKVKVGVIGVENDDARLGKHHQRLR